MSTTTARAAVRTGWASLWTRLALAALLLETVTGLLVTFAAFGAAVEWSLLLHTAIGLLLAIPLTVYVVLHWLDYQRYNLSDSILLGYIGAVALLLCALSGVVVTYQGLFGTRMAPFWRSVHLDSTWVVLGAAGVHVLLVLVRGRRDKALAPASRAAAWSLAFTAAGVIAVFGLARFIAGPRFDNAFPPDYSFVYGKNRPFAPSLAKTATGGAYAAESLANSEGCGTSGCHSQILAEWKPSAHRYAAMDPLFQKVQSVMAEQNGPESTRYCGGCHDPISLFSGSKNLFSEHLTALPGYQEGVSCLTCHGVRKTDLQGNANYVLSQMPAYLWQLQRAGAGKRLSDFLIRTYPAEHRRLSKRMYKAPEYCAACHKQFIDQEVNRVGWVQLQNQYDNWKASHWFVEGNPQKTVECRECHMPLVNSTDPAAGDDVDYNRSPADGKHRSHRFIAANSLVPALLELPGWRRQVALTRDWLHGDFRVPEIKDKWRQGPVVELALEVPPEVSAPGKLPIRIVLTSNKVGHDFPTGPLDIIQSWVELHVVDDRGRELFSSGTRDARHFIAPGSFLFKAEPVDQYGNLIDRHNLWEMVGVRYRRALFPGYSDTVDYQVDCPGSLVSASPASHRNGSPAERAIRQLEVPVAAPGELRIVAALLYRKVDQYLINFLLGEDAGLTAPVVEMTRVETSVRVRRAGPAAAGAAPAAGAPAASGGG